MFKEHMPVNVYFPQGFAVAACTQVCEEVSSRVLTLGFDPTLVAREPSTLLLLLGSKPLGNCLIW